MHEIRIEIWTSDDDFLLNNSDFNMKSGERVYTLYNLNSKNITHFPNKIISGNNTVAGAPPTTERDTRKHFQPMLVFFCCFWFLIAFPLMLV